MHQGRYVFAQLMQHLPLQTFRRAVHRYQGNHYVKRFTCLDQYLSMALAQLTARESLRDIEICLRAHQSKLHHLGFRSSVARSTLADANEQRDWRIYADFAQALIKTARHLYADEALGSELEQTVYALDSTTIEVCLSLFPWARAVHASCGAFKLHTLLEVRSAMPTIIHLSEARRHDVHFLDQITPEPGAIYLMDRAYLDFERLHRLHSEGSFFLMRAKKHLCVDRRYSHAITDRQNIACDQTVMLSRDVARHKYPAPLRKLRVRDPQTRESIVLLTNHFALSATTVSELYRRRWQIEIFFKWIKQHLRIKAFFGTSPNAVKTQVWIAISIYVLIAIVRKRYQAQSSLHDLLQILSVTLFEKTPLHLLLQRPLSHNFNPSADKQLILFGD